jgi:hypothetical protein
MYEQIGQKSGNHLSANLPICIYKYAFNILYAQSALTLRGINILSSTSSYNIAASQINGEIMK